jgi:hypothetical protein
MSKKKPRLEGIQYRGFSLWVRHLTRCYPESTTSDHTNEAASRHPKKQEPRRAGMHTGAVKGSSWRTTREASYH